MQLLILALGFFLTLPSATAELINISDNQLEEVEFFESNDGDRLVYPISEVRAFANTMAPEATCMDDYLKRRKHLIIKFSAAPVLLPVGYFGGILTGAALGSASYVLLHKVFGLLTDPSGGWRHLGYIIVGAGAGAIAGSVYVLTDVGLGVHEFVNNQRILKSLMEAHHQKVGPATKILYGNYIKKIPQSELSIEDFQTELLQLEKDGRLCDGSLRPKKPRFKPQRLSKRLARTKDIFNHLSR